MHGGANEASMRMLEEIKSVDQIPAFLSKAKRDPQAFRRLGFGNSRYRHLDPRAAILRETCHRVLESWACPTCRCRWRWLLKRWR
jgi:citrate synthase